ncbi:MAG: aminotransferase class III-fold pyridoxal phosphate-dependent enzyme, partial [Gemmatimonadaceae bacterium]|nr:aminotransferase class III-fold pyridoxal phosphate-dependent enzyme [Gemmatimonadaceae bacterium]
CRHCAHRQQCHLACVSSIEHDLFQRHLSPRDVAAIFVEPVQGEGGYIVPPPGFLTGLRELCDRHGILLVFDEVQSGIGRTGRMFACEHEGVEPDILLSAKGLGSGMPIGAMIVRETVDNWGHGAHGSTFGGNPVCCAAALATIELVERELMANAAIQGQRLLDGARRLMERHECIGDVRGVGLMAGLEFVRDRVTREPDGALVRRIVDLAFSRGLLLLGAGHSALRLAPPLVIDAEDVDRGLAMLDACIAECAHAAP